MRFIHFLFYALAGILFQIVKRYTMLFMVLATPLILTVEVVFTLLTIATTHAFVHYLSCLLSYCPYIIALYASKSQSSSTITMITEPRSLLPHSKLHTDCNCNTVVGFDHSSKLHLANAAPSLVSVCSPILQHLFTPVELVLIVCSFS